MASRMGIAAGPTKVYTTNDFEFILMDDRITLLLGGKDFFSASRQDVKAVLAGKVDTRIKIYDYRHGDGYPPFNFNFDRGALSIAEYTFDNVEGNLIRRWAEAA